MKLLRYSFIHSSGGAFGLLVANLKLSPLVARPECLFSGACDVWSIGDGPIFNLDTLKANTYEQKTQKKGLRKCLAPLKSRAIMQNWRVSRTKYHKDVYEPGVCGSLSIPVSGVI